MALAYPLTLADFWLKLPIAQFSIDPTEAVEINETKGGELLRAELGTALWQGEVVLDVMDEAEAAAVLPLISLLRQPPATFVLHDPRRPFPRFDPTGSLIAASSPTLSWVSADGRDINVGGLPVGYQLTSGDWIAWTYGTNPVRRALHQVVVGATAGAGGIAAGMQVTPPVADGYVAGQAADLTRPVCTAILLPNTAQSGRSRATITRGASFRWMQTLGG